MATVKMAVLGLLFFTALTHAAVPSDAERLAFTQHPGAILPDSTFRDSDGKLVSLSQVASGRPWLLLLGYFRCPNLCPVTRASLYRALAGANLQAGRDYSLAVVSIDPNESVASAKLARNDDLRAFAPAGSSSAIHYLTGDEQAVGSLVNAVGFHERSDEASGEIQHPAGVVFATKEGKVSSYLLGVGYHPAAVREELRRASDASAPPRYAMPILLLCFHYDPSSGRYSLEVLKVIRLAALASILLLTGVLFGLFRRERRSL